MRDPQLAVNFFFQAEDGIRDVAVTGVQTCALPILYECQPSAARSLRISKVKPIPTTIAPDMRLSIGNRRSEERRVGKEWRGRGWGGGWRRNMCTLGFSCG